MKNINIQNPIKVLNQYVFDYADRDVYAQNYISEQLFFKVSPNKIMSAYILNNIINKKAISQTDIKNYLRRYGYYITEKDIHSILSQYLNNLFEKDEYSKELGDNNIISYEIFNVNNNSYTVIIPIKTDNDIFEFRNKLSITLKKYVTYIVYYNDELRNKFIYNYIAVPIYTDESRYKPRNLARYIFSKINDLHQHDKYKDIKARLVFD